RRCACRRRRGSGTRAAAHSATPTTATGYARPLRRWSHARPDRGPTAASRRRWSLRPPRRASGTRNELDLQVAVERLRDAEQRVDPGRTAAALEARDRRLRRAAEL